VREVGERRRRERVAAQELHELKSGDGVAWK
jgi:hypothetical protein